MSSNKTLHIGGDLSAPGLIEKLSASICALGECFVHTAEGKALTIRSQADLLDAIAQRQAINMPLTLEMEETNAAFGSVIEVCREEGVDFLVEWHPSDDFAGHREVFLPSIGMKQPSEFPTIETQVDAKVALDLLDQGRLGDLRTVLQIASIGRDNLPPVVIAPELVTTHTAPRP